MRSSYLLGTFLFSLLLLLTACSDAEKEDRLVDLFDAASLDIIAISFPSDTTEKIISIDTFYDYTIQGLKSNGVDTVPINDNIVWSLSEGAASTIDKTGRLQAGSVAEVVAITARVGQLTATQQVTVSAAKFDQVVMLDSESVVISMCQQQQITPIGSYLNDDGSEEIRPVDSNTVGTINWLIRNAEDDTASQRAYIKTADSVVTLQALAAGEVIIQAEAMSASSGTVVTSVDFNQTIGNSLNSLKLCLESDSDLASCSLSDSEIEEDNVESYKSVANFQAEDGSNYNQNVSALSKWGTDDSSVISLAFANSRQQLDVTGKKSGSSASLSVACGNIEQTVSDQEIINGVVLDEAVSCDSSNLNCLSATAAIDVVDKTVSSLSVMANGVNLVDSTVREFTTRPDVITLLVTATYSDDSEQDVTDDAGTAYDNVTPLVITDVSNAPGKYTVLGPGDAEVRITFGDEIFTARITIP